MIDYDTYRRLRPKKGPVAFLDEYESETTEADDSESQGGSFYTLLPPIILGYGFHDKKWRTLQVEHVRPVSWNKRLFDSLVLKQHKKDLIQALATVHLASSEAARVVEGKGKGLILLLHGPPGTGKTLTAESVAELVEKPLYRITCGDVGTDPQSAEKNLDLALSVATAWDSVVLLDEADVFLQARTRTDLAKNALVSAVLRVLESYEGIVILTSNRVGTSDEAYKSRIQLAVQYPNVDENGRHKIWHNLLRVLVEAGGDVNVGNIQQKSHALARHKLNGRQIRNVIKSVRQLAAFHKERLEFKYIDSVVDIVNESEHDSV